MIFHDIAIVRIDEESPFWKMSPKDILASNFEILVTLDSVIESTGNTTQARSSYLPNEILWGFRSVTIFELSTNLREVSECQKKAPTN